MAFKKKIQSVLSTPVVALTTETPKKRVVRKTPAKKIVAKKVTTPLCAEEITIEGKTPVSIEIPKTVERVIFIHRCTHCQHVPLGVNVLFTLCFVMLAMLSTFLLYTIGDLTSSLWSRSLQGEVETVTLQIP